MAQKEFKAESKRLLDLMINSIYTHKEIFLRELISNASDAVDKLAYRALTDEGVGLNREDFKLFLTPNKEARTLTLSDNGIGMTEAELEENLGTIARSGSLQFKQEMAEKAEGDQTDIIGQFGVGFYAAFMVADHVEVTSKAYGSDQAWTWASNGAEGYTMTPAEKETVGTDIVLHIKDTTEEEDFDQYLDEHRLDSLVKKYSDYIHYPIVMEMEHTHMKPRPEDAGEDYKPEYETHRNLETLNSMRPLWQRSKNDLTTEDYNGFYKEKFGDWEDPIASTHVSVEGQVEYKALLYVPGHAPFDYYTREFEKGVQLYSSGVLIMDKCADLVPDCFSFLRGVVDSPDFSLNISREMLQHTRQLKLIANNLEKKVKAELLKLQKENREEYETFWTAFSRQLKYGVVSEEGSKKELLRDLLLFHSSKEDKLVTLAEYAERMPESQEFAYFLCADSVELAGKLPQAERMLERGFEILYLTDEVDEFIMNALMDLNGKKFKNVSDSDALPQTDEEKAQVEQKAEENKDILEFVKEALGDKIQTVRLSHILKSAPVYLAADGPITLEMEKYFQKMDPQQAQFMKAQRVLELNPESGVFAALRSAVEEDKEKATTYAQILYHQALMMAGLPIEDPTEYTKLVCSLMG